MTIHRLESTDAWIMIDLGRAERSVGMVRRAPKVLQNPNLMPVRSTTYAAASFGRRWGGAAAGINATDDDRAEAVVAFAEEIKPMVDQGLALYPGPGLGLGDLEAITNAPPDPLTTARGAVAAVEAVLPGLGGARTALAGGGPWPDALGSALPDGPAAVVDLDGDVDADVLFVAGSPGVVDHEGATRLAVKAVVPLTPVPVTARALAVLTRSGTLVVPDFLSTAAPLITTADGTSTDEAVEQVRTAAAEVASGTGTWLAAAERAEAFLATWLDELPFGRPLA